MLRGKSKITLWWIACLALWPVMQTFGQLSTANISGIVEDSTGARIPNAAVRLINSQTGAENDSTTSRQGAFLLPGVIPGTYVLQIDRNGFATAQITGLVLNVGETKSFLVRLHVGSTTQTVRIDASGMAPTTSNATVSTVVNHRFVANIPLNGRSFQDLVSMTPGVTSPSPQTFGAGSGLQGDFSVNGQRPDDNSYTIDGVSADFGVRSLRGHIKFASNGDLPALTALGTTQSLASVDDLQQFRVLTSNYSAAYGRTTGGQFTLLTSSGTNRLHGSLYDYVRNFAADAADWFTGFNKVSDSTNPYQQNDYGGAVGGPVSFPGLYRSHGKTFFFGSYEGLRVTEPTAPLVQYAPSNQIVYAAPAPLRRVLEDFGGEGPSTVDNPPASTGLATSVSGEQPEPGSIKSTSIRIDHSFSPKISAFVRSSLTPSESKSIILNSLTTNRLTTQTDTLGLSFQMSASSTNEFRLGYGATTSLLNTDQNNLFSPSSFGDTFLNSDLGIPAESFPSAAAAVFIHSAGAGDSEINTDEAFGSVHQWNLRDTLSFQTGHHLLQFGIDQRHVVSRIHPPALSVEADFFNPQAIQANSATDIAITKSLPAAPVFNEFAAFMQDKWQASKKLMISSGLRWAVDPAPHGQHGADAYTALGNIASPATLRLAPRGTPLWHTSWLNLAPRFGAAWIVNRKPARELVVRAGAGIFFATDNRAAVPAFSALGFSTTMHPDNVPVPVTPAQLDFSQSVSAPYMHAQAFVFPRHLQLPYAIQWNVAIEKSLGRNQTFTASYVGANGRRLLRERRENIHSQNPAFGEVNWFPGGLTSNYEALQLKFQRFVSHGLQALASYTWSHTLDYGSIDPAWPLTRGNSNLDLRQNFEATLSWNEPKLSGSRIRAFIFGGWGADARVTARTGFPITPLGDIYSDPATGDRYFSGVNLIPNRPQYLYGSQYPGGRMLNGGPYANSPAFALPLAGAPGDMPRNKLRGFADNQVNIAFRREIPLHHRVNLQFRAEAYNLFNHPDLGYIDPSLTDQLFGQATLMLNQSFGPTGALYEPGGPRSMQLSLRLNF